MASNNKKNKAKNSFLYNGGDKHDDKISGITYFTKRQRNKLKTELRKLMEDLTC